MEITTTKPKALARNASSECSPALWRRLTNAQVGWADAALDLAEDPDSLAELALVSDRLQQHVEPCGPHWVVSVLGPLMTLYGVSEKSEGEAKAFWGFYIDALGELPKQAVKGGVGEYVADAKSEFFPKPGPLKALCERHAIPIRMAASRARKALQLAADNSGHRL
jgi:hypothetical protein